MTKRLTKLIRRLGYFIAGLIILAALLESVGHLLTPVLNKHLPDFETWSSELLKIPVKIGHVEIAWNFYEPELVFDNVTILNNITHKPAIALQQIKLNLNIFRSLFTWQPLMESIKLTGMHATLSQPTLKEFNIEEVKNLALTDKTTGAPTNINDVLAWIFSQPKLILIDIDIAYHPPSRPEQSITLRKLTLKNNGNDHELMGNAVINQEVPTQVNLRLNWSGKMGDWQHITAQSYIYLEGLSLPQWLHGLSWKELQMNQGIGSAKIWITWEGQLQKIQSQFQFYDLELQSNITHQTQSIPRLSGHVGWKREGDKQIIAGDDILINLPEHLWPTTSFRLTMKEDKNKNSESALAFLNIRVGYVDVMDIQQIAFASGFVPEKIKQTLKALNIQGEMRDVRINLPPDLIDLTDLTKISFDTQFSGLGFNAWQKLPGARHLNGLIDWNGKQGNLHLNSYQAEIRYDSVFADPLPPFSQLVGALHWEKTDDGTWTLSLPNFQALNEDINLHGSLVMMMPVNDSPIVNVSSDFTVNNAAHISKYLPLATFDKNLTHWLQNAFVSGEVEHGRAILRGKLVDFPFANKNGNFEISGIVKDAELSFAPDWPNIRHINGELIFSGSAMTANLNSGQMLETPLSLVHAVIPDLLNHEPAVLTIQGFIQTDFAESLQFIQNSPLQKTVGRDFAGIDLHGPMQLKLGLTVPLKNPEATEVQGDVVFTNANLNLLLWKLNMTHLNGSLQFTEKDIIAKKLVGQLFDHTATLDLSTEHPVGKPTFLKANLENTMSVKDLQTWLNIPLARYADGSTVMQTELHLMHAQSDTSQIVIKTDLRGIAIKLPDPYAKKAEESKALEIQFMLPPNQPIVSRLHYGDALSAVVSFHRAKQDLQFVSGELRLGEGQAALPSQPGLVVTAQFKQMDWNILQPYFDWASANKLTGGNGTTSSTMLFRGINLRADTLNLFGQSLTNAAINIAKSNNNWLVNINSSQVVGQVTVPTNLSSIQGSFQHFYLAGGEAKSLLINPKKLPALSMTINDVRYDNKQLGNLILNTTPNLTGMDIKQLQLKSSGMNLNATGSWSGANNKYTSRLQGDLSTSNINQMLKQLGFDVSDLIGSTANVQFNLSWPNAPYHPTVAGMSGNLTLKLGQGRIVHLSQSTEAKIGLGRMLSIFSLQNIPRRLSLNFSDLFQNGYSFDSIQGTYKLQNGSAYTDDTRFSGPVASINIAGRIGLEAKDYDLKLGVTTYVTSSLLPAAIGIANPIAGVAAWVASAVVSHVTSSVASYQYKITGPWENPSWAQIGRSSLQQTQ